MSYKGLTTMSLQTFIGFLLLATIHVEARAGRHRGDVCIQGRQKGWMYLLNEECEGESCYDARRCTPSATHDAVGYALWQCMEDLQVHVSGCDVKVLTTTETSMDGMPCGFLHLAGNLTGTQSAAVLAHADAHGFREYFKARPTLVMEFGHRSADSLVHGIWSFLREFFVDQRFSEFELERTLSQPRPTVITMLADTSELQPMGESGQRDIEVVALSSAHRRLLDANTFTDNELAELHSADDEEEDAEDDRSLSAEFDAADALQRRGRRPSAATLLTRRHNKIRLTRPQGCKHRFRVHHSSKVLTPDAPPTREIAWIEVYVAFACASVMFTIIGLSACLHFQRSHAEYMASHHDLAYIKQQLEKAPTSLAAAMPALFQPLGPAPAPVSMVPARTASAPAAAAQPLKAPGAASTVVAAMASLPSGGAGTAALASVAEQEGECAAISATEIENAVSAPLIDLSDPDNADEGVRTV